MIRRRLRVTGKVQNVFFRAWTAEQARSLGIDGWVRNRADGSVEAVVQGPPELVETMIARLHEGPPAARVDHVAVADEGGGMLAGFHTHPTA